jgi:hypothetical protein
MNIQALSRNPRAMKALTGLSYQEYSDLIPLFEKALIAKKMGDPQRIRRIGAGIKGHLPTAGDKLFFTLFYYKTYPTFDVLGFWFNKSRGRSCEAVHFYTEVVEKALGYALVLPIRKVATVEEFMEAFPEVQDLFLDGTERRMERPKNGKRNRRMYSGKKKAHTRKHIVVADYEKRIRVLSPAKPGRRHDKSATDTRLLAERIPPHIHIWTDSGLKGLEGKRPNTHIVKTGTKKKPLTETERTENRLIASFRIVNEHAIGGMKRFHIMLYILRNKIGHFDNRIAGICAGLWNWHLNYKTA